MRIHPVVCAAITLVTVAACSNDEQQPTPEAMSSTSFATSAQSPSAPATTTAPSPSPLQDEAQEAKVQEAATRAVQRVDAVFNDPSADVDDLAEVATGDYLEAVRQDVLESRQRTGEPMHRQTDVLGVILSGKNQWLVPTCVHHGQEGTTVHLTVVKGSEGLKLAKAETYSKGKCGRTNSGNEG